MRWSLHAGFAACPADAPGALVLLADDPLVVRSFADVVAQARRDPARAVAVRRHPFVPHPVYLPRAAWPPPPVADDDHGLRDLLGGADTCWIADAGNPPVDVDEVSDIAVLADLLSTDGPAAMLDP
jgi:CTP:molybdopterin cytidylyltransferase MocA